MQGSYNTWRQNLRFSLPLPSSFLVGFRNQDTLGGPLIRLSGQFHAGEINLQR